MLGICYGMQTMAAQLGGEVAASDKHEYGYAQVRARGHSRLLRDIEDHTSPEGWGLLDVWMSHGDRVDELPPGFHAIAPDRQCALGRYGGRIARFYGLQFHPEVTHTRQGRRILEALPVRDLRLRSPVESRQYHRRRHPQHASSRSARVEVVLGLSGGVDSSVVAALLHRAIGDRLTCIFVDNGLLRLHEGDQVMATFAEHMGVNVIRVNAEDRFLKALQGRR